MNILRILFLVVVIIAVAAVALRVIVQNPVPISLGTNTLYYGYINDGKKFGVTIGETGSNAQNLLEDKGFSYGGRHGCLRLISSLVNCKETQTYDFYRVKQPLRQGWLYLEIDDDKVVAIVWNFEALPHVDF